ncbi:phosphate starvation-inducible PhoH-like protein [Panacagrimonas perspica]|uniref:PhoH-like protein n=1 Tax=Panacagrimonas perspica TaxID=381431 RepID=A0A4R7NT74_9GAMM|nr:PhoH family protein [Panacagrimonas perspica]TDU24285.1 phosphate starvation-inducible PhoH-like protein [Panacagrimonas perspica]THD04686.1 phosphate starvation-inducible protein PhoH [Panacagrimonas perspica]
MKDRAEITDLALEPDDHARIANVAGAFDEHLRQIELRLGIEVRNRGNRFRLVGNAVDRARGEAVLRGLFDQSANAVITSEDVHLALLEHTGERRRPDDDAQPAEHGEIVVRTKRGVVRGRGVLQKQYLKNIASHDLSFGIGPAGTGKTYLAVASAVQALEKDRVRRIVLTRPAVEAGEKLGFLPGDMTQKVDPYLRPLYDALYEMLGFERVARLIERAVIEVAPLAFMRGRTLNESFIILDEAQNTTQEQMKMFLTRIGFGSVAVVTGDVTQIDLPRHEMSGLKHAMKVLDGVKAISFAHFRKEDVVRHPLVQAIVHAYELHEAQQPARPA